MSFHVSQDLLERFQRGEASRKEAADLLRHLVKGCQQCARLVARSWLGGETDADYDEVFLEAFKFATEMEESLAVERLRGWAQWSGLEPLAQAARVAIVRTQPDYQTIGLYERLLEAARWLQKRDPSAAIDVVQLALVVIEHVPALIGRHQARADFQARTWAHIANAYRLAAKFESAREAINYAWRLHEDEGSKDALDRALIISIEASFMRDIGEFEMAEAHLEGALTVYRLIGDEHGQGKTLIQMGENIGYVDPARALKHTQKGLRLISLQSEPILELCAKHNLALFSCLLGRPEDALAILDKARPLYALHQDSWTQLRLHWLEGKIAFARGEFSEARDVFTRVWEGFRSRGIQQEMVLVTIDLAETIANEGEVEGAAQLVAQASEIMASWGIHRDALAAMIYLHKLLAQGRFQQVFATLRLYYLRRWNKPEPFADILLDEDTVQ